MSADGGLAPAVTIEHDLPCPMGLVNLIPVMPIYEFACPKCRVVFSFLSKTMKPDRLPVCPKCGNPRMAKQMSRFASPKGLKEASRTGPGEEEGEPPMPNLDDPRIMRAMGEMERELEHLDENNPKHMARMMRRMKEVLPPGSMPKEMDIAIKRLEAGEDPEKIEEDMGDLLGDFLGGEPGVEGGSGGYSRDTGLYDY